MCWSASASVAMVAVGGAAAAVTFARGDPRGIWLTLGYFTVIEGLQAVGYAVVDECGSNANWTVTLLSYLHIVLQPLFINAFAMAIAPAEVPAATRRWVWALAGLVSAFMLLRLVPLEAFGQCRPGDTLCGAALCLVAGEWHIGWEVPLNDLPRVLLGTDVQFPGYLFAVFVLPLLYGAWRFVVFNAIFGPLLAYSLTSDMNEMPAIWCLFSVWLILISLSPFIRHRVMDARVLDARA